MTEKLVNRENIRFRGFGSFSVREYDSYTGRNNFILHVIFDKKVCAGNIIKNGKNTLR